MSQTLPTSRPSISLSAEIRAYAEDSYPGNHTFKITEDGLKPKCKLAVRYRKLRKYYPEAMQSFLDLSCSKGFFVFTASQTYHSKRSLGVDIFEYEIDFCHQLKAYYHDNTVNFRCLQLHELAEQIDQLGGPFETALLVNTYQYLYFGSDRSPACYRDHDKIFSYLRRVCSGRLIFNNRVEFETCQRYVQASSPEEASNYTDEKIRAAASKYFTVKDMGTLGRYPLWVLEAK
ncbi:MAG: hypothetical protein SFW66_10830 [Gammaproteobacteria bacterium]|nr:hypothetical protein [Gammaproteobacteria bacterium]